MWKARPNAEPFGCVVFECVWAGAWTGKVYYSWNTILGNKQGLRVYAKRGWPQVHYSHGWLSPKVLFGYQEEVIINPAGLFWVLKETLTLCFYLFCFCFKRGGWCSFYICMYMEKRGYPIINKQVFVQFHIFL